MNQLQFLLVGFCVIGFFGSLSLFTPNVPWRDFTVFFRKEKKTEYLQYSNKFLGKTWLAIGCSSLVILLISFVIKIDIHFQLIIISYITFLLVMRIMLEISWQKTKNNF
ncbi:hypothetical protein KUA55_16230 [Enterococcus sp. ALS3]|uniref:SdpI family protein n=1 Tax=Enterococcus alishanensis TaxID=1303817 RepID=A0ABS6TH69_9ENTE|nr:hypothetical protein [Enterococcus alishanensis]MBV7392231.1 hypothetical protein [Enterococcus alishanensis]